jgi:hypothetical protein
MPHAFVDKLSGHAPLSAEDIKLLEAACGKTLNVPARHDLIREGDKPELKTAIREAFAIDGPAIVDAVVASDEMPNLPHIEPNMIGNYALAKIKEAVLSVTG